MSLARLALTRRSTAALAQVRAFALPDDVPSYTRLEFPALSPTMEEGNVAAWNVDEGQEVTAGDSYCDVVTDKATVSWDAIDDGYIAKLFVEEGTEGLPVGTLCGIQVEDEADVAAFKDAVPEDFVGGASAAAPAEEAPKVQEAPKAEQPSQQKQQQQSAKPSTSSSKAASPLAQSMAKHLAVDLSSVQGTGPHGRVVADDVAAAVRAGAGAAGVAAPVFPEPTGDYTDVKVSNVRKVIAERLTYSKQQVPHYYLSVDCRVDRLMAVRAALNASADTKLSVNDFLIKAAALALRDVPAVNASWRGDSVREYDYVDISVAVQTDTGLITPIVKDADLAGLTHISKSVKDLAGRARDNKLAPEEFQGGTFTISNLGMFGVKQFSAIINPPQAAILAVGAARKELVPPAGAAQCGGDSEVASLMNVTMSCDHRVVDGAVGAQWLQAFQRYVEDPQQMLL
ncbi:MAG: hypothetical protein MHM6MM_007302 [Cercozoa sp. M6MM]